MTQMTDPWTAVLWDLDGTLVDTEGYWQAAEERLAASYGKPWSTEQAQQLVGSDLMDSARHVRDALEIDLTPDEIVRTLIDDVLLHLNKEVPWRPGAKELLLALKEAGVRLGLVTMSYQRMLDPVLAELPKDIFEFIVTGDTATRGKPNPEPYLQGAAGLGVEPRHCLAIEDSETGATSAERAGCQVVVVPHLVPVRRGADRSFLSTPEGVTPDGLAAALARGRSTTGQ